MDVTSDTVVDLLMGECMSSLSVEVEASGR